LFKRQIKRLTVEKAELERESVTKLEKFHKHYDAQLEKYQKKAL